MADKKKITLVYPNIFIQDCHTVEHFNIAVLKNCDLETMVLIAALKKCDHGPPRFLVLGVYGKLLESSSG